MGESGEETRLDMWKGRWETNNTGWHKKDYNENLLRYWPELVKGLEPQGQRVLLPLCGKTKDLGWFYRQGYSVVGVEGVRQPVDELFQEENLEYNVRKVEGLEGGWVYQSTDKRFTVYISDFLKVNSELIGKFDAVFDRGSLEALVETDREGYVSVMKGLLKPDFRYQLSGHIYDPSARQGPPRPLPLNVVETLFQGFNVKQVGSKDSVLGMDGTPVQIATYHIRK